MLRILGSVSDRQQLAYSQFHRTHHHHHDSDPLNTVKKAVKKNSDFQVGGQPGHKGAVRYLYSESDCAEVINLKPEFCSGCGSPLEGEDANPYRHQHVEIPPIKPL